jgi:uncharacterized membrane protein YeaQ/YmgE (transglycosylase-associated protein family)
MSIERTIGGGIAGILADAIVEGIRVSLIDAIIVGILGAFVGGWLLGLYGVSIGGNILADFINAVIGATILLVLLKLIRR